MLAKYKYKTSVSALKKILTCRIASHSIICKKVVEKQADALAEKLGQIGVL